MRHLLPLLAVLLLSPPVPAAEYQTPPQVMVDMVDADPTPSVSLSPDRARLLILDRYSLPAIEDLAQPELRLGGLRIEPRRSSRSRISFFRAMRVMTIADGKETAVSGLPANAKIAAISWAPDSQSAALVLATADTLHLWQLDIAAATAKQVPGLRLNGVASTMPCSWSGADGDLVCLAVPEDRGTPPEKDPVPEGPVVEQSTGVKAAARTYQDLLQNTHDEDLFAYYFRSQVVSVSREGKAAPMGRPGLYDVPDVSPDAKYLLVETLTRPFSRLVPYYRFGHRVEVWDGAGRHVSELAKLPAAEQVPIGRDAVPTGRRYFGWRADVNATVYWAEAKDGGDPRRETEVRDEVYLLPAPFAAEPKLLARTGYRFRGVRWGEDSLALVTEYWWSTRHEKTWKINPDSDAEPLLVFDRSSEDRYTSPGSPTSQKGPSGHHTLRSAPGGKLFFMGAGASPEGDRPFADVLDLDAKKPERLWRSEAPFYEYAVAVLDDAGQMLLTRRESKTEPPNYYVRNVETGKLRQLTDFPHPYPQLEGVSKELIRYQRADGVDLTANLYLPAGYEPSNGPLPMLLWAYPREFKSASSAGQTKGSPYRFVRLSTHGPLFWLTQGFAVLDDPTMPIVGEGKTEPNDSYVKQLVSSAAAAIKEAARRGVGDPNRVAIGGHSYGAFMTANLLAHSDLFRAGIAQSGAYNRTLTPFGFQAEERTFWEAPEVYFAMSPFMHADKVNEPILMLHGQADNNSGTFPIQSERFFHALKGHGGIARLVMLPHESHGYRSRESVLHMLYEKDQWLKKYVLPKERQTTTGE